MTALHGIRVLDCTHFIAGPFCSQTLADHGAEVIKVEPVNGEASRKANPMYEDYSIYFASLNRNKKGLAVDMKSKEGKEIIHKLVKTADLLVTNYSVGVPEKLGIDYDTISKINPKISMVHITGFGLTGDKKFDSAFDGIVQAMSGISHLTGEADGKPLKAGLFIADHIAGIQGAIGALLALQAREKTGKGQLVDVGMLDSMISMLAYNLSLVSVFDIHPHRAGSRSTNVFATTFPSKDGYLYIAPLTQKMWEDLCTLIGRPDWKEPDSKYSTMKGRLKYYDELEQEISNWTSEKTTDEIIEILKKANIACGKVNTIGDLFEEKQLKQRNMLLNFHIYDDLEITVPGKVIKMSEDKIVNYNRPPFIGEHTEEILLEIGYSNREIAELLEANICACTRRTRRAAR